MKFLAQFFFSTLIWVFLIAAPSFATSTIVGVYNSTYGQNETCSACHLNGNTTTANNVPSNQQITSGNGGFTSYGGDLANLIARSLNGNSSSNSTIIAHIQAQINSVEPSYAPRITSSLTQNISGNATSLTLTMNAGRNANGSNSTVSQINDQFSFPVGSSNSGSTTTISVFFSSLSLLERGNARRSGTPYNLQFSPRNAEGFQARSATSAYSNNLVRVTFQNIAPTGGSEDKFSVSGSSILNGNVLAIGGDNDDDSSNTALTVALEPGFDVDKGDLTLNSNGTFTYTPPAVTSPTDQTTSFSYRLSDNENAQAASKTDVVITILGVPAVNVAPVAQDDSFDVTEDVDLTGNVLADNGNGADFDADADDLVTTVLQDPEFGSLTLSDDGSFTFTPFENATGDEDQQDSFRYQLSDGAEVDEATVTFDFTSVNDPPVADTITLTAINEGQGEQSFDLLDPAFVSDADGDVLTVSNLTTSLVGPNVTNTSLSVTLSGSNAEFNPADLEILNDDESADLTLSYDITDTGGETVSNTLTVQIIGLDNGLGRIAGEYADKLSTRYNNHFLGQNNANASCHSCHQIGQVDADIDSVNDCTSTVFTPYGLGICLARNPAVAPLTDLAARLEAAEEFFAPKLESVAPISIAESAASGDAVGDPLVVSDAGMTITGGGTQVLGFGFGLTVSPTSPDGMFAVDENGQITVNGTLTPGTHLLDIRPINDAGQRDGDGNVKPNTPGFFPTNATFLRAITITVMAERPVAVADAFTIQGETTLDVSLNDTGGVAETLSIQTTPSSGSVSVNSAGQIVYTPDVGFSGDDSFSYVAENSVGTSDPATVTVAVVAPGGLLAVDDTQSTALDTIVNISVLDNDLNAISAGANATVVTLVTPPDANSGTAVVVGQSIRFTPAEGFTGTATLVYKAINPATSGLSGSNATVTLNILSFGSGDLAAQTSDPELIKVADAFEQTCLSVSNSGGSAEFLAHCANIVGGVGGSQDTEQILRALRNEENLAVVEASSTIARGIGNVIGNRIRTVRSGGGSGVDLSALNVTVDGQQIPSKAIGDLTTNILGLKSNAPSGWQQNPHVGAFIAGELTFGEKPGTTNSEGFDLTVANMAVGIDFQTSETTVLGAALGYSNSTTSFNSGGELEADGVQVTAYGSIDDFISPGVVLSGHASLGFLRFSSDRRINFTSNGATVDEIASARFNGHYLNIAPRLAFSQTGAHENGALIGPALTWFVGLDYLLTSIDGYSETGGGGLALATQKQNYQSLIAELGVEATHIIVPQSGPTLELFGSLSAKAELLDQTRSLTSSFVAGGANAPTFTVTEAGDHGLTGSADFGVRFIAGNGTGSISIGGDFGGGNAFRSQRISLGYSTSFSRNDRLSFAYDASQSGASKRRHQGSLRYLLDF